MSFLRVILLPLWLLHIYPLTTYKGVWRTLKCPFVFQLYIDRLFQSSTLSCLDTTFRHGSDKNYIVVGGLDWTLVEFRLTANMNFSIDKSNVFFI